MTCTDCKVVMHGLGTPSTYIEGVDPCPLHASAEKLRVELKEARDLIAANNPLGIWDEYIQRIDAALATSQKEGK